MRLAVISQSARIYAHFAHQAGYQVYAVDGFADADTCQLAEALMHWPAVLNALNQAHLDALFDTLDHWQVDTLVIGAGFEHQHQAYAQLYARYAAAGNTPQWLAQVKQPHWLAETCSALGIATPEIRLTAPDANSTATWLLKQQGGCGGMHIRPWHATAQVDANDYFQAWQPGISVGALCIGNGLDCQVIGVHQLHQAQGGYHYAGASLLLDAALTAAMQQLLSVLYTRMPLLGIFSLDALWHEGQLCLLEVNPRLSASMRLYDGMPLMQAHLAACKGQALSRLTMLTRFASHRILYARQPLVVDGLDWPSWVEDRPCGGQVAAGQPLCSLYASGNTLLSVHQQLLHQQTLLQKQWGFYVSECIEWFDS